MVVLGALLSAANIIFSLCNAALQVRLIKITPLGDRWLRYVYFSVCLWWAGLYAYIFFFEQSQELSTTFGQIFVRPTITITLALMLAGTIYRYRSTSK